MVTVLPLTVHTDVVVELNVGVAPDDAVAATVNGASVKAFVVNEPKLKPGSAAAVTNFAVVDESAAPLPIWPDKPLPQQ